jgi:hypothetical protein
MEGQVENIEELKVPPTLYKFRHTSDLHLSTLLNKEIFIPKISSFNDPQDGNLPFRYRKEELTPENIYKKCIEVATYANPSEDQMFIQNEAYRMQKTNPLEDEQHLERFDKIQYDKLNRTTGVMCLTPNVKNFLMWSYYGDSHKGMCIGYDTKNLIASKIFGMGGKVLYSNKFPLFPMFPDGHRITFLNLLYTKSKVWKHEDEYRLLHTFKNGNVLKIPTDMVSEIVLGCKITDVDALTLTEKIGKVFPNITISRMRLNKTKFGLNKETVIDNNLLLSF